MLMYNLVLNLMTNENTTVHNVEVDIDYKLLKTMRICLSGE